MMNMYPLPLLPSHCSNYFSISNKVDFFQSENVADQATAAEKTTAEKAI